MVIDPVLGISNVVLGAAGGKPLRLGVGVMDEELADSTGLDPSSYEFQLHRTMIRRALK